jgi:hypothetical protein
LGKRLSPACSLTHITIDQPAASPHPPTSAMNLHSHRSRLAQPKQKAARIAMATAWALRSNRSGRF